MQDCPTENRDTDVRWLKPLDFVEYGGREGIGRCVVVEDTMDSPLGTITRDGGLYSEVGFCGRFVVPIS